ncbi:MAG: hypothetical protein M1820_010605 [Bogoriella megaspora]|nr:MAG: hypothetical protein M1820_010605 [Bogoriella megaspora]
MSSSKAFDVEGLNAEIDKKAHDLFKTRTGFPQLQLFHRISAKSTYELAELLDSETNKFRSRIKALRNESNISPHVLTINQANSRQYLDISFELFKIVLAVYEVFPKFWKFVFVLGFKIRENEFQFAGCKKHIYHEICQDGLSERSAYMLRRAEYTKENAPVHQDNGDSPWSIRSTAVYCQSLSFRGSRNVTKKPKSTFLLIGQSESLPWQDTVFPNPEIESQRTLIPGRIHLFLVETSMRGWRNYMNWLDEELEIQTLLELDEHVQELELCQSDAVALRDKATNTSQMLSELLTHEYALALREIQEGGARDAAAFRDWTLISLFYLPITTVIGFFSSKFVLANNNGDISVIPKTSLLAACALPLMFVTIAAWWSVVVGYVVKYLVYIVGYVVGFGVTNLLLLS